MRGFRIKLGVAATLCAFGVLAAPAFAHKERPKFSFGKFVAHYPLSPGAITPATPVTDKGIGSVEEINLGDDGLIIREERGKPLSGCAVKSAGKIEEEKDERFFQAMQFSKCYAAKAFGKEGTEKVKLKKFHLDMLFNSNGSLNIGEGEGEVKITANTTLTIPVGKGECTVVIPQQTVPARALVKETEYEASEYETEHETFVKLKKFPAGFQEKLDIEIHYNKFENWVQPSSACEFPPGVVNEVPGTPGYGYAVYNKGTIDMELEEIEVKNGDLGFETRKEVEEKGEG